MCNFGSPPDWLPPFVSLTECMGNAEQYIDVLYSYFYQDFVSQRPSFLSYNVGLKKYPLNYGKEATFWHFISSGPVEEDRYPDMRRCERIRWPRPMIEAVPGEKVHCWYNERNGEQRAVISLLDFSYIVIMAVRDWGVIPWTAYFVEERHRRRKLEREFLKAQKSSAALC